MKFTAVGDLLIQRRFPVAYNGFDNVKEVIARGDFRFCNLETTVNKEGECWGEQYSGGSWLRMDPECVEYLDKFGFNAINCANNHALDFSHLGVLKTMEYLRLYGYQACGIGENLASASAPVYIDTPNGRIAMISIASLLNQSAAIAGEQSRRVKGRPGMNGFSYTKRYTVTKEQADMISNLAEATRANCRKNISRSEGYTPPLPENCAEFDDLVFEVGDTPELKYILNKDDLARIEKSVFEAKLQADYIVVSIHCHECGEQKNIPVDFLPVLAKACIDYGAHSVIGHGPHLLRGIEIYKKRPIFYSLGDFILQNENIPLAPEEFYKKYGLNSDETLHKVFAVRSNNFTRGIASNKLMFETVIPYWEMENGELTHLELTPVLLSFDVPRSRYGMPMINKNEGIVEMLAELSRPYGTEIIINDGVGTVKL